MDKNIHLDDLKGIKNILTYAFSVHSLSFSDRDSIKRKGFFQNWFPYDELAKRFHIEESEDELLISDYLTYYYSSNKKNHSIPRVITQGFYSVFMAEDTDSLKFYIDSCEQNYNILLDGTDIPISKLSLTIADMVKEIECENDKKVFQEILLYLLSRDMLYETTALMLIWGLLQGFVPDSASRNLPLIESPYLQLIYKQMHDMIHDDFSNLPDSDHSEYEVRPLSTLLQRTMNDALESDFCDYQAMYEAGCMYFYRFNAEKENDDIEDDYEKAYQLLLAVAESDHPLSYEADLLLAKMHYNGEVPSEPQAFKKTYEYRKKALNIEKTSILLTELIFMKKEGIGCTFDYEELDNFIQDNIDTFDDSTRYIAADFYFRYGKYRQTIELLESIEGSNPRAEYRLGMLYLRGVHKTPHKPDVNMAEFHFCRAADYGMQDALYQMGLLYFRGSYGHQINPIKARDLFKRAADKGSMDAQYHYAWLCRHGIGGERNLPEAIRYFEIGAKSGHNLCMCELGDVYQESEVKNYEKAFYWAKKALESGDVYSEFTIANMYVSGHGCARNYNLASMHYKNASNDGFKEADMMLDKLKIIKEYRNDMN